MLERRKEGGRQRSDPLLPPFRPRAHPGAAATWWGPTEGMGGAGVGTTKSGAWGGVNLNLESRTEVRKLGKAGVRAGAPEGVPGRLGS